MLLTLGYDLGEGPRTVTVGIRAQVGWELRTKSKISDLGTGITSTAMVGLLLEQLKADGDLPEGAVNELTLSAMLKDINPVDDDVSAGPTNGEPLPA